MIAKVFRNSFAVAAQAVADRSEEINKLNVFPVPDGDTGTNMSLTLGTVTDELSRLPLDASLAQVCQTITHGSLMGARGNSGVITSQILRGLAEGFEKAEGQEIDTAVVSAAFKRSVRVAFQAVRKPVEGTILTVLRDCADAISESEKKGEELEPALQNLVEEAYASVRRTPELLPVLREHGVTDAGAFGLAVFLEAFIGAALGNETVDLAYADAQVASQAIPQHSKNEIELIDDWDNSEYRYCTEFLVHSDNFDMIEAQDFIATMGDCDLLVGMKPTFKVHVHTDEPQKVLEYMLARGQISEVHINNMDIQSKDRAEKISEDLKPLGVVAVSVGEGVSTILESLGVDKIVSGGQTMNPSTKDIMDAIEEVNARSIIVLPNNKNIIMSAQSAAQASEKNVGVVPTKSVLQAFSALFALDAEGSLEDVVEEMTDALEDVHDGEITTATRDSKAGDGTPIKQGDTIGIIDGKIDVVSDNTADATLEAISLLVERYDGDTLTILAGEEISDDEFEALVERIHEEVPSVEIDEHRGDQPLYPIIFAIE